MLVALIKCFGGYQMKKVIIAIILIVMITNIANSTQSLRSEMGRIEQSSYMYAMKKHPNYWLLKEKLSVIPQVKIRFKNGSVINYTSIDTAIIAIYREVMSNKLSLNDIVNVSMLTFSNYLKLKDNVTSIDNYTEYLPGYKLFFSELSNPAKYNYSGKFVAVSGEEFLYNVYGERLTKCVLYGKLNSLEVRDVYSSRIIPEENKLTIISYVNASDKSTFREVINELNRTAYSYVDLKVIVVDISNTLNSSSEIVAKYPSIYFSNNINTSIGENTSGSFESFGFIATPAYVYVLGNLLVVRKTIGFESSEIINQFVKTILLGDRGLFAYIVSYISANNLVAGKKAEIYIRITEGVGNVTVNVGYEVLDKNNNTLLTETLTRVIQESTWIDFKIDLSNDSRSVIIRVSIYRNNSIENYISESYEIKIIETKGAEEGFPWDLVVGITILLIFIIIIGTYAYKHVVSTSKVRKKRVKKKRRK